MVDFEISMAQAEQVFSERRGSIQDVLPDVPAPVREIFISGETPLEWARLFGHLPEFTTAGAVEKLRELFRPFHAFHSFDEGCAPDWAADAEPVAV